MADGTQAIAGGQTLIPLMKQRLVKPASLVSLNAIAALKGVWAGESGEIIVGGTATHSEVAQYTGSYPVLAHLVSRIADPAVRNRATIGGSLAANGQAYCYPAAVLGSNASICTNRRIISADEFFIDGSQTALEKSEIITRVLFPVPEKASYQKFSQPAFRYAIAGVFVAKFSDEVRVAVTGAANKGVFRWHQAESALTENFSVEALAEIGISPDSMIDDIHGRKDYRAHLVKTLALRAVNNCVQLR